MVVVVMVMTMMTMIMKEALRAVTQVIIAGAPDAPETKALMAAAHGRFAPDQVVLPIDPANQASRAWYEQNNPEAWAMIEGATQEVWQSVSQQHSSSEF